MTNPLSDENRKTLERVLWPLNDKYPTIAMSREDANTLMNAVRAESTSPVQGDVREAVIAGVEDAFDAGVASRAGVAKKQPDVRINEITDAILSAIRPDTRGEARCTRSEPPHNGAPCAHTCYAIIAAGGKPDCGFYHPAPPIPAEVESRPSVDPGVVERVRAVLVDWDGSPIPDEAEPRIAVSCGELRALLSALEGEGGSSQDHAPSTGDARPSTRPEGEDWVLVPKAAIDEIARLNESESCDSLYGWQDGYAEGIEECAKIIERALNAARPHD